MVVCYTPLQIRHKKEAKICNHLLSWWDILSWFSQWEKIYTAILTKLLSEIAQFITIINSIIASINFIIKFLSFRDINRWGFVFTAASKVAFKFSSSSCLDSVETWQWKTDGRTTTDCSLSDRQRVTAGGLLHLAMTFAEFKLMPDHWQNAARSWLWWQNAEPGTKNVFFLFLGWFFFSHNLLWSSWFLNTAFAVMCRDMHFV